MADPQKMVYAFGGGKAEGKAEMKTLLGGKGANLAEMSRIGLKTTQYSLLSHIVKLGPIRPGDLAAAMKVEPSTLTRNLKPLIDAGWVALAHGIDGRSRSVTITEAGRTKRTEAQRRWKVAQLGLNKTLGVQRVVALHALINESLELLNPVEAETDDI